MSLRIVFTLLILISVCLIWAAEDPVREYLAKPGVQSYANAVKHLSSLDKEKPESMQAKLNLAYIANFEAKRLMEFALADVDKLSAGERFSLGNMYLGMDKFSEAVRVYDAINQQSPKWSCPWRHKGEALYRLGDYASSAQALEMAIETNEEHYDAYIWYAKALTKLSRYAEAKKAMDKAFTLDAEEEGSHQDEELPEDEIKHLYQEIQDKLK